MTTWNRMVARIKTNDSRTYVYGDGTQVLEESFNGQRTALQSWGAAGLIGRIGSNGRSSFYVLDGIGSVVASLDSNANIVQSYEYSAHGESLSGRDSANLFRFVGGAGGRADDDTGLVYFWNRWYDAGAGRWVSEDPIRQAGGLNLFGYVGNNSVKTLDANGLSWLLFQRAKSILFLFFWKSEAG